MRHLLPLWRAWKCVTAVERSLVSKSHPSMGHPQPLAALLPGIAAALLESASLRSGSMSCCLLAIPALLEAGSPAAGLTYDVAHGPKPEGATATGLEKLF